MKVPILLYHRLFDEQMSSEKYDLSKREFEDHIKYLSENGFQTLSFAQLLGNKNDYRQNFDKNIILTFDDGNYSDYLIAFPILRKYGFTATFFITANWVGTESYVNWNNLREMSEDGMSIQSHSLNHIFLSDLDATGIHKELSESKSLIEDKLGMLVDVISIPGGFFSREILTIAEETGYKAVCTSTPGINMFATNSRGIAKCNRFVITRSMSFNNFQSVINCDRGYVLGSKTIYLLKSVFKMLLGSKLYYEIWSKHFKKI